MSLSNKVALIGPDQESKGRWMETGIGTSTRFSERKFYHS